MAFRHFAREDVAAAAAVGKFTSLPGAKWKGPRARIRLGSHRRERPINPPLIECKWEKHTLCTPAFVKGAKAASLRGQAPTPHPAPPRGLHTRLPRLARVPFFLPPASVSVRAAGEIYVTARRPAHLHYKSQLHAIIRMGPGPAGMGGGGL